MNETTTVSTDEVLATISRAVEQLGKQGKQLSFDNVTSALDQLTLRFAQIETARLIVQKLYDRLGSQRADRALIEMTQTAGAR